MGKTAEVEGEVDREVGVVEKEGGVGEVWKGEQEIGEGGGGEDGGWGVWRLTEGVTQQQGHDGTKMMSKTVQDGRRTDRKSIIGLFIYSTGKKTRWRLLHCNKDTQNDSFRAT